MTLYKSFSYKYITDAIKYSLYWWNLQIHYSYSSTWLNSFYVAQYFSTKSNVILLIIILIKISIKENRIMFRTQSLIDNYTPCYIIIELYCKIKAIKHQCSSAITSIKSRNSILIATWSRTLFSSCVNTYASCVSIVQL